MRGTRSSTRAIRGEQASGRSFRFRIQQRLRYTYSYSPALNTYGPRQHPDFVIPSIIRSALTQDALMLGNLTPTRDFTYVDDIVEAFLRLAETGKGVYNVASGVEISIKALVARVAEILGKPLTISSQRAQRRSAAVEIERMCADISRIKALGWKPRVSLIDGLTNTITWYRDQL